MISKSDLREEMRRHLRAGQGTAAKNTEKSILREQPLQPNNTECLTISENFPQTEFSELTENCKLTVFSPCTENSELAEHFIPSLTKRVPQILTNVSNISNASDVADVPQVSILSYLSLPEEFPTDAICRILMKMPNVRLCVPAQIGRAGDSTLYLPVEIRSFSELTIGKYGIREPCSEVFSDVSRRMDVSELDIVLVPGLAFDRFGNRLGRGRGHFDRLLAAARPDVFKVGLAFDFQIVDLVPTEPHDVPMNWIFCCN